MNNDNDPLTDAARLQKKFDALKEETGMGKAVFAREFKVPGGASMISQHLSGHRPISLDAMVAYAKGFKCGIAEISPDLAFQLQCFLPSHSNDIAKPEVTLPARALAVAPEPDLAGALRVIAEALMPLDATALRRASGLLADLGNEPEQHASLALLLTQVVASGKRRAA